MQDMASLPPKLIEDPDDYCTLQTCPLDLANFTYDPSLAGNVAYLAIFAMLLIPQVALGIRHKTWGFMVGMIGGLILEIIGYAGRVQLHFNPFPFDPFLEYLICLTLAPALISASIYVCLGRIVIVYGETISRVKPRSYTVFFIGCDLLSLILQAVGGALAATADDRAESDVGVNIMIAGLSTQVASLLAFILLCGEFTWRVRKTPDNINETSSPLRHSTVWKMFIPGLGIATVAVFIRCVYRVAELSSGFNGALFNNEALFMIFEGPMIIIASLCLTVLHPGISFKGKWLENGWRFKERRDKAKGTFHSGS